MATCCPDEKGCQPASPCPCEISPDVGLKPQIPVLKNGVASCCAGQQTDPCAIREAPGLRLWGFVEDFIETAAGPVPRVSTQLKSDDHWGTVRARLGIGRDSYGIAPGLYAVGQPDTVSPVLVTANYKLTFDTLRVSLVHISAWIVVLDTHSINVWCAAGKGTFSTREVSERVKMTALEKIVTHRRLILPQLSATGVAARQVKTMCGFEVVWGPVHAKHIKAYLDSDMEATSIMREVTFGLRERMAVIPVELCHMGKPTLYALPAIFLLSGLGQGIFSFSAALSRGGAATLAYILAVAVGAILAPALLPWLPGRAFALKGAAIGVAAGALLSAGLTGLLTRSEMLALTLFITAVSSYLAMNFTGSTPFTSPTGVEKEMRKAIPAQAVAALAAISIWVGSGFMEP